MNLQSHFSKKLGQLIPFCGPVLEDFPPTEHKELGPASSNLIMRAIQYIYVFAVLHIILLHMRHAGIEWES